MVEKCKPRNTLFTFAKNLSFVAHFNKCQRNYEKAQRLVKNNHTLDSLWKKGNCERLSSASSSNSMSQDEQEDFSGADAIETGSDK